MQMSMPVQVPAFVSWRSLFEQRLSALHKRTDLNELKQLHALIYKSNLHRDPYVAPKLISAFSLCGKMGLALNVFDQIPSPNVHICNALIRAYIRNSEPEKAFDVFSRMQASGVIPNSYTYNVLLKACSGLRFVRMIHACVEKCNHYSNFFVRNSLIAAYFKCGLMGIEAAKVLFGVMEVRDLVTYNSMISGLVKAGELKEAMQLFAAMEERDLVTYNTMISGFVKAGELKKAKQLFDAMEERDLITYNSMISGLVKAGEYKEAKQLFGVMEQRNLVTCNSMISGLVKAGELKEAMQLFGVMEERDLITYNSMINGLVKAGELKKAKQLFDEMPQTDRMSWNTILYGYVKAGELSKAFEFFQKMSRNVVSWSTVISGYAKMGDIEMAKMLFDKMPEKDLVAWAIIISGYAERGLEKEAMALYDQMEGESFKPDDIFFVSILSACAQSGLLILGMRIHRFIMKSRHHCAIVTSNALIDMYCKCGSLSRAWRCFEEMGRKDLVSWNVMIHGLAMNGQGKKALQLFDSMKLEGLVPDKVTFVAVLSACSHAGLVEDGIRYFYSMERRYMIAPDIAHYGCMIVLLVRGGRLNEALRLANCMPLKPNDSIWRSLIGACIMRYALQSVEEVVEQLVKLDPANEEKYHSMLSRNIIQQGMGLDLESSPF